MVQMVQMVQMVSVVKALSTKQSNKKSEQESQVVSNKPDTKAKWPVVVRSSKRSVSEATGVARIVRMYGVESFVIVGTRLVIVNLEMDVTTNLGIITDGRDRVMLKMQIKGSAAVRIALTSMDTRERSVVDSRPNLFFQLNYITKSSIVLKISFSFNN